MNEHIRRGNDALAAGDLETAKREFCEALDDRDDLVRRIARNRLHELFPQTVYASSQKELYHRDVCIAVSGIWSNHLLTFKDWQEAEQAGYSACHACNPPRPEPRRIDRDRD